MYIIDKRYLKLTIKHSLACEDPLMRAPFSSTVQINAVSALVPELGPALELQNCS